MKQLITLGLVLSILIHPAQSSVDILAPMPGQVMRIHAAPGEFVARGAPLLELEVMKMQFLIQAAQDGFVHHLPLAVGQYVDGQGVLLARMSHLPLPVADEQPEPIVLAHLDVAEDIVRTEAESEAVDESDAPVLMAAVAPEGPSNGGGDGPTAGGSHEPVAKAPEDVGLAITMPAFVSVSSLSSALQSDTMKEVKVTGLGIASRKSIQVPLSAAMEARAYVSRYQPVILKPQDTVLPQVQAAPLILAKTSPVAFAHMFLEQLVEGLPMFGFQVLRGIMLWILLSIIAQAVMNRYSLRPRLMVYNPMHWVSRYL
jgi:hypothetical protein